MDKIKPILFDNYPNLEGKVPWIPLLTNLPSKVERLKELEKYLIIHKMN